MSKFSSSLFHPVHYGGMQMHSFYKNLKIFLWNGGAIKSRFLLMGTQIVDAWYLFSSYTKPNKKELMIVIRTKISMVLMIDCPFHNQLSENTFYGFAKTRN